MKPLFLIAISALFISACSQNPANRNRPACPTASQMEQPELLGRWRAEVQGTPGPITLDLAPHPEWNGTVKGRIHRPGADAIIVGDVDKGVLSMEESSDGKRTTGTWSGDVVEGSCAREIRGEWIDQNDHSHRFTLRKAMQ